ncbi:MAG: hypothetical protein JW941_09870 [Candidatus Coatesbacteria bacterium]|nr:hypothetical protein [Candidatus Coatesbacteria bacterium]
MSKCIICEQRKGKRFCPLKNEMICSLCCGIVQTEGNCPEDCPFLQESKTFATEKQDEREIQLGERFKRDFAAEDEDVMATLNAVSTPLNDLLVVCGNDDGDLQDADVVEALDDLIGHMKKGVGQVLAEEDIKLNRAGTLLPKLKDALDELDDSVPEYYVVPCLEIIRGLISLSQKDDSPRAYLDEMIKLKEEEKAQQPEEEQEEEVAPSGEPVAVDVSEAPEPEPPAEAPTADDLFEESPEESEDKE